MMISILKIYTIIILILKNTHTEYNMMRLKTRFSSVLLTNNDVLSYDNIYKRKTHIHTLGEEICFVMSPPKTSKLDIKFVCQYNWRVDQTRNEQTLDIHFLSSYRVCVSGVVTWRPMLNVLNLKCILLKAKERQSST